MTHSSIMPMTFKGRRMYVYPASRGVVGVSADDGSILWECPDWKVATNVPAPLPLGDDRIFLSGYGAGSMMLQLIEDQGKIIAKAAFKRPPDVFGAEQQTPIFYKDHIYGVIPGGQLVCLDRDARQLWASGGNYRFGLGPFIIADGLMILMNDKGVLTLAEASESAFKPLAQAGIFERGRDSWGPLALAGGRLLARDFTRMVCLDLRKASYE
jgi:outer membrane protein assembly factor BamB